MFPDVLCSGVFSGWLGCACTFVTPACAKKGCCGGGPSWFTFAFAFCAVFTADMHAFSYGVSAWFTPSVCVKLYGYVLPPLFWYWEYCAVLRVFAGLAWLFMS
jgi:hypothetical protein